MAKSNSSPLAEEVDPYLALNEKVEAALAGIEALSDNLDKATEQKDFNPSVMRAVMGVLKDLTATLTELARGGKAPPITVQAPAAPNVSIRTDTPKEWDFEVTDRDDTGRINKVKIKAV